LRHRLGGIESIDETHRAYDALHFPLMFPCGEDGWHIRLPYSNLIMHIEPGNEQDLEEVHGKDVGGAEGRTGRNVSVREFYASMLQVCELTNVFSTMRSHDMVVSSKSTAAWGSCVRKVYVSNTCSGEPPTNATRRSLPSLGGCNRRTRSRRSRSRSSTGHGQATNHPTVIIRG
jgi:hypothetical protein